MNWSDVGGWLKENAGAGASLVGSLLTGNIPGAVAAGVALVSSATGQADPQKALQALQQDSATVAKLQELANEERDSIRKHLEEMTRLQLQDLQSEHAETQKTIRAGDVAEDPFVRRTRPAQSWLSLIAGIAFVFAYAPHPDAQVLMILFGFPAAYLGLRGVDKWRRAGQAKT
jgi:hypothetical protein